jgi:hypothetical protein
MRHDYDHRQKRRMLALALLLGSANLAAWAWTQLPPAAAGLSQRAAQAYQWAQARQLVPPSSTGMAYAPSGATAAAAEGNP